MTNIRTCHRCKTNFRAFSMKSRQMVCDTCKEARKKKQAQEVVTPERADAPVDPNERIEQLEKSLEMLHSAIAVEVENQIRTKLKPMLQELMDEQLNELKTLIAAAQSKALKAERKLEEAMKNDFQDLIVRVRAVNKSQTAVRTHLKALYNKVDKMKKDNS